MKIKIKNKKIFFTGWRILILSITIALVTAGGSYFYSRSHTMKETPHLMQKLEDNDSKKEVLVFFRPGCPYCEAGQEKIKEISKKTKVPVYYVNTRSEIGKVLVKNFDLKYASTLTVIDSGHFKNIAYADKINGKIVPLTSNIKRVFNDK
ncbi:thioredoxin family protein [Lactococcus lactis]|uniref:thioredoxin family protein n=1 Tax=Lactococcus lactis TaxID=1358 RepID=UPI0022E3586A|nr:thioredoxin family protein [Lactococcus lactis]